VSRLHVLYIYCAKRDIIVAVSSDANGATNVVANKKIYIHIHNYTKYTCIRIKSTVYNEKDVFWLERYLMYHVITDLI